MATTFNIPFYHELVKKVVIGFGSLFSEVQVIRRLQNGTQAQVVKCPIAYGPKEKFLARLEQDPELTGHTYITLPRLAFEITSFTYDSERKVNRNNKVQCYEDGVVTAVYSPVPYNIEISLHALTKGSEDGFAIVEQILPLFTPEYSLTIDAIPSMNIQQDVPIVLNNLSVTDDYEGDFSTRRLVTHTFNFTAKMNLYGPIRENGVIKRTDTELQSFNQTTFETHTSIANDAGEITIDEWNLNGIPL